MFERFDRINEAGVRGEAALGLGLPLTRQFLEAHGGKVELESQEGQGHDGDPDHSPRLEMILADEQATEALGRRARGTICAQEM